MSGGTQGGILAANVSATTASIGWTGGRTSLVVVAQAYATQTFVQLLGPDGQTWININPTTISAATAVAYDVPAGQYRLFLNGGSPSGVYANLVTVPY